MLTTESMPRLLNVAEASKQVGISDSLIYDAVQAGELVAARFGRRGRRGTIRIDAVDLLDWVNRNKQAREEQPCRE